MKRTALIMAGGRGERFWPRSRMHLPKQFISITGDGETIIQLTIERVKRLVAADDIYIATGEIYRDLVREQLPEIPEENILCEPIGRNTAPCIALGAAYIRKKYGDATMLVLPSDHIIKRIDVFAQTLEKACEVAECGDNLVTIGITPTYPETGYGYIEFDPDTTRKQAYAVKRFVEKPDLQKAQAYLASGGYLWNSGMFVWKTSTLFSKIETLMPALYEGITRIEQAIGTPQETAVLKEEFPKFESISIDYGIMEKSQNIYTFPGAFGWDDVGSWLAIERVKEPDESGNVITGNVVTVSTNNCTIEGDKKLIATVGLDDIVVVDTDDVTLICNKQNAGEIKKILETLRLMNKTEYI